MPVETLHIYDSDTYAAVPVDVIRSETVKLPAFREVEALLVQSQLKTGGIFRRSGAVRIWLSDDRYKVPAKIVTSIALGQLTAGHRRIGVIRIEASRQSVTQK